MTTHSRLPEMGSDPTLWTVPSATATTGVPKLAKMSLPSWKPVSARKPPNGPPIVTRPRTGKTNWRPISRFLYEVPPRGAPSGGSGPEGVAVALDRGVRVGVAVGGGVGVRVAVAVAVGCGTAPS